MNLIDIIRIVIFLIVAVVCILRRKNEIGGWLLFYFISVILSMLLWIAITIPSLPLLDPSSWCNKGRYLLFIFTALPNDLLFLAQFAVSMMLLSSRFWDWKSVNYLRIILLAQIIFMIILLPVDLLFFPENTVFDMLGLIAPSIWLAYFTLSKRVISVYKHKDWGLKKA